MSAELNLILKTSNKIEKRVLPRFPLNYLTFRLQGEEDRSLSTFSVKDISLTGVQLERNSGTKGLEVGSTLKGTLSWYGERCFISAEIKWVKEKRLGLHFEESKIVRSKIESFLEISNFVRNLRPLHKDKYEIHKPQGLKYWLQADGPIELFVWTHTNGEIAKFQIILFKDFIEWDIKGTQTGDVINKRNLETPLLSEEEFAFQLDPHRNESRIEKAKTFLSKLSTDHIDQITLDFLIRNI